VFSPKNSSDLADRRDHLLWGPPSLPSNDPRGIAIKGARSQAFLHSIDEESYSQHRTIEITGDRDSVVFDSSFR